MREKVFFAGFVGIALTTFALGRDLLADSFIFSWAVAFGGSAALAVLSASLYRLRLELRASRHEVARNEAELSFALQVQKALFPKFFPKHEGLEFAAFCIPAQGISGDYYDILTLPNGRLAVAIADISGKGIPAAILMANLQALLRSLAENHSTPAQVCNQLNRHLAQVTEASRFATFFYGEWDCRSNTLSYVNAGHNSPLLFGSRQGEDLRAGGFPLGMFNDVEYEMGSLTLQAGDLLVLYSDGIIERGEKHGRELGVERLQQMLQQMRHRPLDQIREDIIETVRNWSPGEPEDDMTMVLARVKN